MTSTHALAVAGSVVFAGWLIAQAIENGLKAIADRIDNNSRLLDRVGTKLDALWSPIAGLNNAAWEMVPDSSKRFDVAGDDDV